MRTPGWSAKCCLWLLIFGSSAALWAQRFTFREYGPTEGLTSLDVNCLLQDHAGFLWVGTDNGLFRYDGERFQPFTRGDGLPNVEVTSLAESPSGVLWVATQGGIAARVGRRFKPLAATGSAPIAAIAFGRDGSFYASAPDGLLLGTPGPGETYAFQRLVNGDITSFRTDGADVLYSQAGDLWRIRRGKTERLGSPLQLPFAQWEDIARDSQGQLWVRSSGKLYVQAREGEMFLDRSAGIPSATRGRLYADPQGGLIVPTSEGAVVLRGEQRQFIDAKHGFPDVAVAPILFTKDHSLWLGTRGTGVLRRLGHGEWLSWKREDGLLNSTVWAILPDMGGRLWVGTDGGLSIFSAQNGRLQSTWDVHSGLGSEEILAIAQDPRSKDVFVAGNPGSLNRFDRQGRLLQTFGTAAGITREHVMVLAVDTNNFLWIGGHDGCFRSRLPLYASTNLSFEHLQIPGIPAAGAVRALVADEQGGVWVGTSNGLVHFDGKNWSVYTMRDGLKADSINAIAERHGVVWLAYRADLGVTRLQQDSGAVHLTHLTASDGLSSNVIFAIALDDAGGPWLTTDNGLDFERAGRWRHLSAADGLVWDDTDDRALSIDTAGKVWIGTSQGMSTYDPSVPVPPSSSATTILTSASSGSQTWRDGTVPVLRYADNALTLRFSSLSFATQDSEHFRYRLGGFQSRWIETTEKSVQYAGLPAGNYVFEIEASRPDGSWDDIPARFAFSIKPPVWQTWWFYTLAVAAAVLAGTTVWRFRVRSLMARQHLLEKEVLDRTEELRVSHERLREIAYRDALTHLPNRRLFTDQFRLLLAQPLQPTSRFALLLLDLDRFKQVNDEFGHDIGDAVLVEAAARICTAIGPDDFVARLGGDEFAILLQSVTSPSAVDLVASRITAVLAHRMQIGPVQLHIGCSTGVALFPEDGSTQEGLYKAADVSLYRTKRRNRTIPPVEPSSTERFTLARAGALATESPRSLA